MKTYKLGNKTQCIIRSCYAGFIGQEKMEYDNQPYTILKNVETSFSFEEVNADAKAIFTNLSYNIDNLREITISNVELNDKILNLIFSKNEDKLCSTMQNCMAEDNKIYITAPTNEIYQVFIYDIDGKLEKAYGTLNTTDDNFAIDVEKNEDYLVFFSYEGNKSFKLNRTENLYLTLDLIITGNADDELNNSYIHIDKCAVRIDKNMYFRQNLNAIDLRFIVINDNNDNDSQNYITLE